MKQTIFSLLTKSLCMVVELYFCFKDALFVSFYQDCLHITFNTVNPIPVNMRN